SGCPDNLSSGGAVSARPSMPQVLSRARPTKGLPCTRRQTPLLDLDRVLIRLPDHQNVSTLHAVELGVLGPLQVRRDGAPVPIPGDKPRAILTMLGLHGSSIVSAETLLELLWGDDPPRTAAKALQTHISSLRRTLDDGFVLTEVTGWVLAKSDTDALRYKRATKMGRDAAAAGDSI